MALAKDRGSASRIQATEHAQPLTYTAHDGHAEPCRTTRFQGTWVTPALCQIIEHLLSEEKRLCDIPQVKKVDQRFQESAILRKEAVVVIYLLCQHCNTAMDRVSDLTHRLARSRIQANPS